MAERHSSHSRGWKVGSQPLGVDFQAGCLVEDAGLLAVREFDVSLGVLSDLAGRLPDPRAPRYIQHSLESLLVQQVYPILAGYPDGNDADHCRNDSLFQILRGLPRTRNTPWPAPLPHRCLHKFVSCFPVRSYVEIDKFDVTGY